jgi:hypothetical protein
MKPPAKTNTLDQAAGPRTPATGSTLIFIFLAVALALVSWMIVQQSGLLGLVLLTVLLTVSIVFTAASYRYLVIPVLFWFIALMGLRNLFLVHTPGLPDISPDRVLFVWILSIFLLKMALGERPRARWQLLDTLLVIHLVYQLMTIAYHDFRGFNSWTRSFLMGYSAYFVAKYVIDGRRDLIAIIFGTLLAMNFYYGITSIGEKYGIDLMVWPKMILDPRNRGWAGRSHGIFLQPAVLGIVMGMLLPIQFYYLRAARHPVTRALLYASLPIVAAGLFFTYTRGSWLVGLFGMLAVGLVGWRRYLPLVSRLVIIASLFMAAGLINFQADEQYVERMGTEHTITGRISTLGRTYRMFLDNPLFGVGYFGYNEAKVHYADTIEVPIFGQIGRTHDIESSIHDMYLGQLAEEGAVGAGLQMAIYLQILFLFRRKYLLRHRGDPFAVNAMPVLAGLMVGYLIGGFSIDYRYFTALLALFYFAAGLIAGYRPAEERAAQPAPPVTEQEIYDATIRPAS